MSWVIMSPGRESDLASSLYTRTSVSNFDRLCDIDVTRNGRDSLKS